MKKVLMPAAKGPDWWIIVHDLTVNEGRYRRLRPIHVLTHLGQNYPNIKSKDIFSLCIALENKLFGVLYHRIEFLRTLAPIAKSVYSKHRVQEYAGEQAVICGLEAYLNAIYTALELVSQINRRFHPQLPIGFRKQSKKYPCFSFIKWGWLPYFYDIRTELTHFNSPLPLISQNKLIIEFKAPQEVYKKGKQEISFKSISEYAEGLFDLCDAWANDELKIMNTETTVTVLKEVGLGKPLKHERVKIGDILKLLD